MTLNNELINFSSSDPSVCGKRPITGLATGESIVGIDFRPEPPFMRLYALADTGQLYLISNPGIGVATPVTPGPPPTLQGTWFGIDFDPLENRLRVVSDTEQNLRVDPDTGALVATDSDLVYAAGDPNAGSDPTIVATAYTSNFDGATSTRLYAIDPWLGVLVTEDPPGSGIITTVASLGGLGGSLGGAVNGFDISGSTDIAYFATSGIVPEPVPCAINLKTGEAMGLRDLSVCSGGGPLSGLSVANSLTPVDPSTWGQIKSQFAR